MSIIRQLEESVVNRIAAGEIIVQTSNALKELLENSIDANSTNIEILVKDGGLKLIQITDDGDGINKDDLELLCKRFATSKLNKFEDLQSISTYGFRGEALASISHISRLSVITKTAGSDLAYKSFYLNGNPCTSNFKTGGGNTAPRPVAGKKGTQITIEDLFYNSPSRLKVLRSKRDEFSKILDVIGRYAVHTEKVGFNCKKFGETHQVLSTRPNLPLTERIRTIFGYSVANDLIIFGMEDLSSEEKKGLAEFGVKEVKGAISNSNYLNKKKIQPIIFINNRLVSCNPLKRSIATVYNFFLPKGSHPFFYLSIVIEPQNLDVNIHPTKNEVRFLFEEEIIEVISGKVHQLLSDVDVSRKFKTQKMLSKKDLKRGTDEPSGSNMLVKKYRQENKLVRTDSEQSKILTYVNRQSVFEPSSSNKIQSDQSNFKSLENRESIPEEKERSVVQLDSITQLRESVIENVHRPLTNILSNATYVGIVDESKRLCCFQHDVNLFVCDYSTVLYEFFYQIALAEFHNYGTLVLSQPCSIQDILEPLYSLEQNLMDKQKVVDQIVSMKDMFREYFSIDISTDDSGVSSIVSLPLIMKDVEPPLAKLPFFIYRLGSQIDYSSEKKCLQAIMRQISLFYIPEALHLPQDSQPGDLDYARELIASKREHLEHVLENSLFPALKHRFLAPTSLLDDVIQIADLPGLYRVFERC